MLQPQMLLKWNAATDLPCKFRVLRPGTCPAVALAWLDKACASNSPMRGALLTVLKLLHMGGIAECEDPVLTLRAVGVDLTSKQNQFSLCVKQTFWLIVGVLIVVVSAMFSTLGW